MQPTPDQPSPDRNDQPEHNRPEQKRAEPKKLVAAENVPALRRTVVRPPAQQAEGVDSAFVATRLTNLVHELSSLIDGSMRVIGLARRSLEPTGVCAEQVSKQLDTVTAAMVQMAELVRQSMIGLSGSELGPRMGFGTQSSVAEAVRHGAGVLTPLAEDAQIRVDCRVSDELAEINAGPIYCVVTNGVKNAIESIRAAQERAASLGHAFDGEVVVRAWLESARAGSPGSKVRIEIMDNGVGVSRLSDPDGPFSIGYSTKPGGFGIGLSMCREIVEQLGGTIELRSRPRDQTTGRSGATLSVEYPAPPAANEMRALAS